MCGVFFVGLASCGRLKLSFILGVIELWLFKMWLYCGGKGVAVLFRPWGGAD